MTDDVSRIAQSNNHIEYPTVDWPVSEADADWRFVRSQRDAEYRIRFLWDTGKGLCTETPARARLSVQRGDLHRNPIGERS